jgi:hypothetical protein
LDANDLVGVLVFVVPRANLGGQSFIVKGVRRRNSGKSRRNRCSYNWTSSGSGNWDRGRWREWHSIDVGKIQSIEVRREIEEVTVRIKYKLGCLGLNGKLEAFFELLVIANAEDVAILIFPGVGEIIHEDPEANEVSGTDAGHGEKIDGLVAEDV